MTMYNENSKPSNALLVRCENGWGVDLISIVDGDTEQRTYVATTLEEALQRIKVFFESDDLRQSG